VLPASYSRADVTHNLQRAAVLAAQMFSGKVDFRSTFFDDRLHQPYRAPLMPGLGDVLSLKLPCLMGACLSGAGPSILAFVKGKAPEVGEAICQVLREKAWKLSTACSCPTTAAPKAGASPSDPLFSLFRSGGFTQPWWLVRPVFTEPIVNLKARRPHCIPPHGWPGRRRKEERIDSHWQLYDHEGGEIAWGNDH